MLPMRSGALLTTANLSKQVTTNGNRLTHRRAGVASKVVGGAMDEWTARESPWHVRSVAVFCMQRLAVLEPVSQQLREPIQRALVRRQVCETHPSVLQSLKADSEMAKRDQRGAVLLSECC